MYDIFNNPIKLEVKKRELSKFVNDLNILLVTNNYSPDFKKKFIAACDCMNKYNSKVNSLYHFNNKNNKNNISKHFILPDENEFMNDSIVSDDNIINNVDFEEASDEQTNTMFKDMLISSKPNWNNPHFNINKNYVYITTPV